MTAQYTAQELKTGLSLAVIANVIWGVSAFYWVETSPVRSQDVVAHRAIWSLPVAASRLLPLNVVGFTAYLGPSLQLLVAQPCSVNPSILRLRRRLRWCGWGCCWFRAKGSLVFGSVHE